jgi:light-regulated signal transduction histidine kinase (bacteriophytochrome)
VIVPADSFFSAQRARIAQFGTANKEIEAFSYSVSHDLRAPLRHIHGFIELFLEGASGDLDEKSLRYIRLVSEASKKMGVLIDDLLAFSRIGRVELCVTRTPLRPLVDEVIRELAPDVKGLELIWEIAPLPEVVVDPAMMRQVWSNLIGNALKFSRGRARDRSVRARDDR